MGWVWWSFFALKEDQTYRVLYQGLDPTEAVHNLLRRTAKHE